MEMMLSLSGERPPVSISGRFTGVGLIRGEYLLRGTEEYITVSSCQARVAEYLDWVAMRIAPHPVWYRMTELTTDEANTLVGIDAVITEADPMKGLRGLRRGLAYPQAFGLEVKVVAEVARQRPNLHLLLPYVMDADEFGRGVDLASKVQWPNQIGSMLEIPSAIDDVARFVDVGATMLLLGFNDLSALITGASRQTHDTKLHPAVWRSVAAVQAAVPAGFCWGIAGNLTRAVLDRAETEQVPFVSLHYSELDMLLGIPRDELPGYHYVNSTKIKTRSQVAASRLRAALEPFGIHVPLGERQASTGRH